MLQGLVLTYKSKSKLFSIKILNNYHIQETNIDIKFIHIFIYSFSTSGSINLFNPKWKKHLS